MNFMRWKPPTVESCIKIMRDQEPVWIGLFTGAMLEGDHIAVQGRTADELLSTMPLPFPPPGLPFATNPSAFEHWWRQLLYVFDIPNPSFFPPLTTSLQQDSLRAAKRFVDVTHTLASSAVMSSNARVTASLDDHQNEIVTIGNFPPADAQAGFTSFLRQCHGPDEAAGYRRVHNILWMALQNESGTNRDRSMDVLRAWQAAANRLAKRSLRQLVYDTFVDREGWMAFSDVQEKTPPEQLLKTFNYGDLLHWGDTRDRVESTDTEPFEAAHQRLDFLIAGTGLAHLYVGFGELVRSAITPADRLLVP